MHLLLSTLLMKVYLIMQAKNVGEYCSCKLVASTIDLIHALNHKLSKLALRFAFIH